MGGGVRFSAEDIAKLPEPLRQDAAKQYYATTADRRAFLDSLPANAEIKVKRISNVVVRDMPQMPGQKRKYHNTPTVANGIKFPSKRQARDYQNFQVQLANGEIRGYAHEVSIPLANSKRRIRIDHMVVEKNLAVRWLDSKGHPDERWLLKRDLIEAQLGIRIECI